MKSEKCGVYSIRCDNTGKIYVGSSTQIYVRWSQHRADLRRDKHHNYRLQRAWIKHGEQAFSFHILEECDRESLERREQHFVTLLNPAYNLITEIDRRRGKVVEALRIAVLRAKWASITHCPQGHLYDETNTYKSKRSNRICRTCNAMRVASIYANETPEETEARNKRNNERYYEKYEHNRAKQAEYIAKHKAEKQEYDRLHRAEAQQRRRERIKSETPEQREHRLRLKRESYHRTRNISP